MPVVIPSTFALGNCFDHISTQTPSVIELPSDYDSGYDENDGGDNDEGHVAMTTVLVNVMFLFF